MADALGEVMRVALRVAALGPIACAIIAGAGLAVLALGFRAFRPAAALVAAGGGALGAWILLDLFHPKLPVSNPFVVAAAAAAFCAVGLVFPRLGTVAAAAAFGLQAGLSARAFLAAEHHQLALVGGAVIGVFVAAIFSGILPTFVPPIIGAIAIAAGVWGAVGALGTSPELFRLPAVWLAFAGVVAVAGVALERARQARRAAAPSRAERDEKMRRDQENKERYDRYMKM